MNPFQFYRLYNPKELFSKLAFEDARDMLEIYEFQLIVTILAPMEIFGGVTSLILGRYWNLPLPVVLCYAVFLVVSGVIFFGLVEMNAPLRRKRRFMGILLFLAYYGAFLVFYSKITLLYWLILIILMIPLIMLVSKSFFFYLLPATGLALVQVVLGNPLTALTVDAAFIVAFAVIMIFIAVEIILLNLVYLNILRQKTAQYQAMRKQREEIASLYEEVLSNGEALLEQYEKVHYLVNRDSLTSLPNRKMIQDQLHLLADENRENQAPFSLVYIDLDNFKKVNDSLGHAVGDKLLVAVSERFAGVVDHEDMLGRLGGDEFALIVTRSLSSEELSAYLTRILNCLYAPFHIDHYEMNVTSSIGVVTWPSDVEDVDDLYMAADTAMYQAKDLGKNTVFFYRKEMREVMLKRLVIENNLMRALDQEELYVEYQPLIAAQGCQVVGFEALLRWRNESVGSIRPAQFIPVMENIGIIHEVGFWVIQKACTKAKELQVRFQQPLTVSINLSVLQLRRQNFAEDVRKILLETEIDPRLITFELTESVFLDNIEETKGTILLLKETGVRIAIDDFGTGYSSLSYLAELPIDILKIDKSFVDNIVRTEKVKKLVASIVTVAHQFGMQVVAEGVETKEQLDHLVSHHCDVIQGFYFSQPLGESEMEEMLV